MKKLLIVLSISIFFVNCTQSSQIGPKGEIELKNQQEKTFITSGGDLILKLTNIQESRCPKGAQCVRAGEAIVTVNFTYGNITQSDTKLCIECGSEFKIPASVDFGGHKLTLISVLPTPDINNNNPEQKAIFTFE